MSLTLLLEKYDVSTEEGFQKALADIEKEEMEVDSSLSSALERATGVEQRLRAAGSACARLGAVRDDTRAAGDMVDRTATLARDVSAKVRQLDLARSRVAECQRRVHDLIDLQLCTAGVEAAIKAHDYETGAAHVARFLSMDPGSVAAARARGAPDPRADMTRAAATLSDLLVSKFAEAARGGDDAGAERLARLLPQLGRADQGDDLFAAHLATQLEATLRRAGAAAGGREGCVFADALTRVLEAAAAAAARARALGRLPRALRALLPVVSAGAARAAAALRAGRGLGSRAADPRRGSAPPPPPLALDPTIAELALCCARVHDFWAYLRRALQAELAGADEATRRAETAELEQLMASSDLAATAQELLAHYLALERYFLEESINKAVSLATAAAAGAGAAAGGAAAGGAGEGGRLVDDVFYITRKVIARSMSTGSEDGVCAVLSEAAALLEERAAGWLRSRLRAPPAAPLPLPAPAPARPEPADAAAQRDQYLSYVCEAELGAQWAARLAAQTEAAAAGLAPGGGGGGGGGKLRSCCAALRQAGASFEAARALAEAAIIAALAPTLKAWAKNLAAPPDEEQELEDEGAALPAALDALADAAAALGCGARLLDAAVAELAARAEPALLQHDYTRGGGLAVERRARRLAAWAGARAGGARERAARLAQAAALLALDSPRGAALVLRPPRLPPAAAAAILARRVDFKIEDIKKLKL